MTFCLGIGYVAISIFPDRRSSLGRRPVTHLLPGMITWRHINVTLDDLAFALLETTSEFLETDVEVSRCRGVLERLTSVCLSGPRSKAFLIELASDFERQDHHN